jgi:hypothetical protein
MSNRFSLEHLLAFSIEGADARPFAQSQFTVSVDRLDAGHWQPLALCEPKGRALAVMMARASENGVELVLPASQAECMRKRLQLYTIGRDARISEPGPVAGAFGVGTAIPALSFDASRGMLAGVQANEDPERRDRWRRLDLGQAIPWLEPATSERHLPQWLGLEALDALAYDKGCYPGQEVIARLHYRGSVKRQLAGLRIEASAAVEGHAPVSDERGGTLGHWLWGLHLDDHTVGLAVLDKSVAEGERVAVSIGGESRPARVTRPESLC